MRRSERTAWILAGVEAVAIVIICILWQTDRGWSSLTVGTGTEALSAVVAGALLSYTIVTARKDRLARRGAEARLDEERSRREAEGVAVWPVREFTAAGEPLAWTVALQNFSSTAAVAWRLHVRVGGPDRTSQDYEFSSDDYGGLSPHSPKPIRLPLAHESPQEPIPLNLNLTWTDAYGRAWHRTMDGVREIEPGPPVVE